MDHPTPSKAQLALVVIYHLSRGTYVPGQTHPGDEAIASSSRFRDSLGRRRIERTNGLLEKCHQIHGEAFLPQRFSLKGPTFHLLWRMGVADLYSRSIDDNPRFPGSPGGGGTGCACIKATVQQRTWGTKHIELRAVQRPVKLGEEGGLSRGRRV